jgi:hypothetical protein
MGIATQKIMLLSSNIDSDGSSHNSSRLLDDDDQFRRRAVDPGTETDEESVNEDDQNPEEGNY